MPSEEWLSPVSDKSKSELESLSCTCTRFRSGWWRRGECVITAGRTRPEWNFIAKACYIYRGGVPSPMYAGGVYTHLLAYYVTRPRPPRPDQSQTHQLKMRRKKLSFYLSLHGHWRRGSYNVSLTTIVCCSHLHTIRQFYSCWAHLRMTFGGSATTNLQELHLKLEALQFTGKCHSKARPYRVSLSINNY